MTANVDMRRWALQHPQPEVEARVMAAMIADVEMRALGADLELGDVSDPRYRAMLEALRNLESTGSESSAVDIADSMAITALERHGIDAVPDLEILRWVFDLLVTAPTYDHAFGPAAREVFAADLRQLRAIAEELRR